LAMARIGRGRLASAPGRCYHQRSPKRGNEMQNKCAEMGFSQTKEERNGSKSSCMFLKGVDADGPPPPPHSLSEESIQPSKEHDSKVGI